MAKTCIIDRQYNPPGFEIHPKDTIVDVGGHIGSFSVLAASLATHGQIFTFEPDEANYKQLKKNTQNFKNVQSFQLAISHTEGFIHFNRSTLNNAENSMFKKGNMEFQVPSTTLEHVFEKYNIQNCDFLKIDCEGAEYPILYATPDSILKRIKKMAIEVHQPAYFDLPEKNYNPEHLESFLRSKGFEVKRWRENAMHDLFWVRRK